MSREALPCDLQTLLHGLVQLAGIVNLLGICLHAEFVGIAAGWDAAAVQALMLEARVYFNSMHQQICDQIALDMATYRGACVMLESKGA